VRRALVICAVAVALPGCGNDKTSPPDLGRVGAPAAFRDARYPADGVVFRAPVGWRAIPGRAPQIVTVATGDAQISVWRYPRAEPLPQTRAQLGAARDTLVRAVKARDATFDVASSRIVVKPGLRAVELIGTGTNQGVRRKVRSLHAYGHDAEVVVDAFAPPEDFARVDRETFAPLARSLKLRAPRS
jgi:hypothetical protein